MLFKVTMVPDLEMTQRKALLGHEVGSVSAEDLDTYMKEVFNGVYNSEYNIFIYAETIVGSMKKMNEWLDDSDCILGHEKYENIVWKVMIECCDPTDNEPVLLNALATLF